MMALEKIVQPHIAKLNPYQPGKPVEELERELGISNAIKIASNENPHGPSPKALAAIRDRLGEMNRYPDGAVWELRDKLASRFDVDPGQLVFGCGADEVLELLAKSFLGPGDEVVYAWPSFAMYPLVVAGMGAASVQVPLNDDLVHDLPAMSQAVTPRTKMVVLCNPNNPTGTSFGKAAFDDFVASLPDELVLVVDEVYIEFARRDDFPDTLPLLASRPGTISIRSFSKLYGLAGLRIGYGLCDPELAGILNRARHPFNVSRLAEIAAVAALDDSAHVETTLGQNWEGADLLARELEGLGARVWPTDTNFMLIRTEATGAEIYEALLREGVIVRPLPGTGLDHHVRITIGTPEENERLLKCMRKLLESAR
ncbi:MAG: histidinol-phosphate transaminase [Myxococcota bacterium]